MKKICIAGGSGFIGSYLTKELLKKGYQVCIISRSERGSTTEGLVYTTYESMHNEIDGSFGVINLAGLNLFDQRWTSEIKKEIYDSRIQTTEKIAKSINESAKKPDVFISASAVGFYGNRGEELLTEESDYGDDYLAKVCLDWEKAAKKAEVSRLVIPRIGIVLEKDGGALGKMLPPFKAFVGGPLGSGSQFFPWVHMDDVVFSILESIENVQFKGVYNCVAPQLITMNRFSAALGKVLNRPSLFSVPKLALQIAFGEASDALVASQKALPQKLMDWNYSFKYDDVIAALKSIV